MLKAVKVETLKTLIAGAVIASCVAAWNFIFEFKEMRDNMMHFVLENDEYIIIEKDDKIYYLPVYKEDEDK